MITDALIIRENNNIGESDRFVTALTRDYGVLRASARGARNMKSKNASATQLLSYTRLTLHPGRDKYIIQDVEPIRLFFELHTDIEKLALAQYFCELAGVLAPQEEPAEDFLRLMLNSLHFLSSSKRDARLVKAVLELRMLSLAGLMPDILACAGCATFEDDCMWLSLREGTLFCSSCKPDSRADILPVLPNVLAAMRHAVYTELERAFSFSLSEEGLESLMLIAERFSTVQLGRRFKTLDFYYSMRHMALEAKPDPGGEYHS